MNYTKQLPDVSELQKLAGVATDFPKKTNDIVGLAKNQGYGSEIIDFLKLFHGSFESRGDFYARTSELVMLIKEERKQPEEQVLSSQD